MKEYTQQSIKITELILQTQPWRGNRLAVHLYQLFETCSHESFDGHVSMMWLGMHFPGAHVDFEADELEECDSKRHCQMHLLQVPLADSPLETPCSTCVCCPAVGQLQIHVRRRD